MKELLSGEGPSGESRGESTSGKYIYSLGSLLPHASAGAAACAARSALSAFSSFCLAMIPFAAFGGGKGGQGEG